MDLDALARAYVLLGLRSDRLVPGLVDAHTGAVSLRRQVAGEPRPKVDELLREAARLRTELPSAEPSADPSAELPSAELVPGRRDFLDRQLTALDCSLRRAAGRAPGFRAELRAYFDTDVELGEPDSYRAAHAELATLLPGGGPLAARMAAYRKAEELPVEWLGPAIRALSGALREVTRSQLELPAEETVTYEISSDRPWSAFNHYLGGHHSRVVINSETGRRASQLPHLLAHEAYPGHHTERCRRHTVLVQRGGCVEHSLFLLNSPQCLLSEGLADLGLTAAIGPAWGRWAAEVLAESGVRLDGELAERVERASAALLAVRQDAALMIYERHADLDEVVDYLSRWLLVPESRARQMLRFLTHPLWRGYTTTYVEGVRLLGAWLDARPAGQSALLRLCRLHDEPLTPRALRADLGWPEPAG
ncbi:MAG: hypothetical protein QOG57_5082 [Pseudonocardiales bacterium]|nr:hypothetical protein [Pseudonocardiales bacterium]